jgi:ATP-dependent Zn protease
MTKKRRIPAGMIPSDHREVGWALENEVLALALEWGKAWLQPTQGRLRRRHKEITQARADELDRHCRKAMEACFAIVAQTVEERGDQLQASGRILEAYPWIDSDNLASICSQGYYYAIK